jgi:2-dehydro-3-deoxyphosphogluconate aldolase/(4S)-4-hydroxy-2-oxoglutarate aldolase
MSAKISKNLKDSLYSSRIIATPHISNKEDAPYVIEALIKGGIHWVEITLRTPIAIKVIQLITEQFPEMKVMAGTVIEPDQVRQVQDAGASVAVSPNLSIKVLEEASSKTMPFIPGVATPSEIGLGIEMGLDTFKFFPAEMIGGMQYLKRVYAPYAHKKIHFIPLGGITPARIPEYTQEAFVLALGGSWITGKQLIETKNWHQITQNALSATNANVSKAPTKVY